MYVGMYYVHCWFNILEGVIRTWCFILIDNCLTVFELLTTVFLFICLFFSQDSQVVLFGK